MTTLAEGEQFVIKKSVLMTDKSLPPEVKPGCYINAFLLRLLPFICHCWVIIY